MRKASLVSDRGKAPEPPKSRKAASTVNSDMQVRSLASAAVVADLRSAAPKSRYS